VTFEVRRGRPEDVPGIAAVCAAGWRDTYAETRPREYIEHVIADFYGHERIAGEIEAGEGWDGWFVAVDAGRVVGAGGGGMIGPDEGELYVLYIDPARRYGGIGSAILEAVTEAHRRQGARAQWVTVEEDNEKGLPFYRSRGFTERGRRRSYMTTAADAYVSLRMWRPL
jgi:ribosomal protein S18 acetylase RimI-like enzyme